MTFKKMWFAEIPMQIHKLMLGLIFKIRLIDFGKARLQDCVSKGKIRSNPNSL